MGSDLTRFMNSGEGDATARGGAPYGEDAQLGASREEAIDLSPTPHGTPLSKPYLIDEKTERRSSIRSSFAQFHALDSLRLSPSNHSRNTSRASHRSTSADHGISQLERQDSMIPDATTWQIRSDEQLDFETMLLSYSLERGQATLECKESGMGDGALKMYLYRTQCAYAWEVTRRLVIVDPDAETQTTRIQSFWLPLADISIRLYDDTFELAWSDCDHDFQEPTKNYVETHSKKYDCNRPNNSIRLKVASSASNNVLGLVQAFCSPLASVRGVSSPPNQQMSLLGGEKVGMFNTMREKQDPILMIVGSLTQGTTTKVYTVPRQMDLRIIMHKDSSAGKKLFQTVITGLGATTYISDAQNMSKMMQRKGTFQKAAQESRKAVFTFAETLSLFDFLEAVTGWELLFFSRLRSVKERRTLSHDLGPGEMMIWQRGGGRGRRRAKQEIVMTYRLDGDGVHGMWISGHSKCGVKGRGGWL